jgi:cytochrome c-type biogenesis protein CcmF
MWNSLPDFGTGVLHAIVLLSAYTIAVALAATQGASRYLRAARAGAYATGAAVGLAVFVLAYGFLSHDFRISYVARYSDRTMSPGYLFAALWGGQDGSLLWWLFLSAVAATVCVRWLGHRYRELQPWVIVVLMGNLAFFALLMLFASNPFALQVGGTPADGAGLNYQLRNFYMIIHPPSLYIGFTSATVPFAFAIAALITRRLDNEWIHATRKWMLFSWLFLAIANTLGMLWAYEELGWGGPWAWDAVENAAMLPWLPASAYLHSTMMQERRGMLKVWNVVLITLTFFLTIFGTWLTRSGLIASVHAFAQSGIGIFFVYYMLIIAVVSIGLILTRLPQLRSEGQLDSALSREVAFLANNWGLMSIMLFVLVATVWPLLSEWLLDRPASLGPNFYNQWLPPLALLVFFLMGAAPLLGWRHTSRAALLRALRIPVAAALVAGVAWSLKGAEWGFPAWVKMNTIYAGEFGQRLAYVAGFYPLITAVLVVFNVVVVAQEYVVGVRARRRGAPTESWPVALYHLVGKAKRRYGGYLVHVGIALMMLGFAGRGWGVDHESSLKPGQSVQVEDYTMTYVGPRRVVDTEKTAILAEVDVARDGQPLGRLTPAKFIYAASPGQPSTEVARLSSLRDDFYVVVGMINPETKLATFQIHVNTLINWLWIGAMIVVLGAMISLWPEVLLERRNPFAYMKLIGGTASTAVFAFAMGFAVLSGGVSGGQLALAEDGPTRVDPTTMLRTGTVGIRNDEERELFSSLICMCGCPRESLETCTCDYAHERRSELRAQMAEGKSIPEIQAAYVVRFGDRALAVTPNEGAQRLVWVVPGVAIAAAAFGVVTLARRWRRRDQVKQREEAQTQTARTAAADPQQEAQQDAVLNRRLDAELEELDS